MKTIESFSPGSDGSDPFAHIRKVAKDLGLRVEEDEGIATVYFPKTDYSYIPARDGKPGKSSDPKKTMKVAPILMTEDGETWTPDFDFDGEPGWVGGVDLSGKRLLGEIQSMVTRCDLGKATNDKMAEFVTKVSQK
jgi:hypothetical protein